MMNMYYPIFYASVFGFFFDLSGSLKMKHRRPNELRNEIYVPSLIDFELKGKSLAWFPVQIKNGDIESVRKLKWRKRRKSRYVEEPNCFQTGKPKRIYNAQEDKDDPNAGNGEDDEGTAYDDYDYYEDDENTTTNTDSSEYETTVSILNQNTGNDTTTDTLSTIVDNQSTTVSDQSIISIDDGPWMRRKYSTEGPLTDETEEPTERIVPVNLHGTCRNRFHTYKIKKYDLTTEIKNTATNIETASFKYPMGTTTYKFQTGYSTNEQTWQGTSNISTSITKIKYYTDGYDEEGTQKPNDEVDVIKTTTDIIVSSVAETPKVEPVTHSSQIYEQSTIQKSTSDEEDIEMTEYENDEGPETDSIETTHDRPDKQSSSKDLNIFTVKTTESSSVITERKTVLTDSLSTDEHNNAITKSNSTKARIECVTKATEMEGDFCLGDVTNDLNRHTRKNNYEDDDRPNDQPLTGTKLRHIETPPYPKLPLDLRFPTCSGNEELLDDIMSPTCAPPKMNGKNPGHNFEKKKEKSRKNRKHCRRKSTPFSADIMTSETTTNPSTQLFLGNPRAGKITSGKKKNAKVIVRIPTSLSDIPVVVVRDPLTQKLSLSLIGAEEDSIQPIYYKPPIYHPMVPPPFSYNNLYSPNIPPFSKIYPYEYMYVPNVGYRYDKANYLYPRRFRLFNNYRWVRNPFEDDVEYGEEDYKNSTNSPGWEIYLAV